MCRCNLHVSSLSRLCRPVLCSTLSSVSDRVLVSPRSAPNCVNLRHTHEGAATHQDTKDRALPWHYATLSTSHVSAQSNPQTVVVHDVDRRTIFAYIASQQHYPQRSIIRPSTEHLCSTSKPMSSFHSGELFLSLHAKDLLQSPPVMLCLTHAISIRLAAGPGSRVIDVDTRQERWLCTL